MTESFEQIARGYVFQANRLQARIDHLCVQQTFRTKAEQVHHFRLLDQLESEKAKVLADAEAYQKLAAEQNVMASVLGSTQAAE